MKTMEIDCGAGSFYDRIAGLYDITFKFNGYSRSLEKYLEEHLPPLPAQARVLDAGCGTGLLTLALLKVLDQPLRITAISHSSISLTTSRRSVAENSGRTQSVRFAQANLLQLPFADDSFDLIMTSGVLEYVPLGDGFKELARVIRPGGYMLHLPVRPSPASKLLEVMFRFKAHPPREVEKQTTRHFRIVDNHRFPPFEPIGWTKTAVLAQKS
ncbi:MAG TPA: class I SAM-dependent methyltransferase [Pyrinomonadaceae bacterium]|nr:class I SAM-dependent methyltransferase [Pyrinomonadaceae bacterium]